MLKELSTTGIIMLRFLSSATGIVYYRYYNVEVPFQRYRNPLTTGIMMLKFLSSATGTLYYRYYDVEVPGQHYRNSLLQVL